MTSPFDFHTHRTDATDALISVDPRRFAPEPGKWYSVGFHPWDTTEDLDSIDYPAEAWRGSTRTSRLSPGRETAPEAA